VSFFNVNTPDDLARARELLGPEEISREGPPVRP
jgi:hypothetical protein